MNNAKKLIKRLKLQPHVEGGYYRQTYCSKLRLEEKNRSLVTMIYYLLEGTDFSSWHRLKSDEIWHYYCGGYLLVHQINKAGQLSSSVIGNVIEREEAQPQLIISAGTWFAAELESQESFVLMGCTVSPGFEFEDFELGQREALIRLYPHYKEIIVRLTNQ